MSSLTSERQKRKNVPISNKFLSFFKSMDAFGFPISFTISNESSSKSIFGGLITILLVIYFSLVSLLFIHQMIYRRKVLSTTDFYNDPPLLELNTGNWVFALGFNSVNLKLNNRTNPLLFFEASHNEYTVIKSSKGYTLKSKNQER